MPVVIRLRFCVITMYGNDHNPPHFHIRGNDDREAQVRIGSLDLMVGDVDRKAMREALEWARQNPETLDYHWRRNHDG